MSYLEMVNAPADIKKMSAEELGILAAEIRAAILKRCSLFGGHIGSNLGAVEATIALHYVFNSPVDKIVFDVSHQCYAHKIITGRKDGFLNPEKYHEISGFSNPRESMHDIFKVGHTSTSVSLATGLAKARDILGQTHNVVTFIGDGSLSGGEAYEGLDYAASELKSNFIVIVNDNGMSMAENHGGIYQNLLKLRESEGTAQNNFFKSLGYDYIFVKDGNNLEALIKAFNQVKDIKKPVVVHICTLKGKGYTYAEENKEAWHKSAPFDINTGQKQTPSVVAETYNDITCNYFLQCIENNLPLMVVTAGTPNAFGFSKEMRQKFGAHYTDVGIAEEHAVTMTAALAKGGCKAVFCVQSSFLQRAYDQLLQEFALNKNPALILVYSSGIAKADATHLGCFDIPMVTNIPNLTYLSPATKEEYLTLLDTAIKQNTGYPIMIRVPQGLPISGNNIKTTDNKNPVINSGSEIAVLADGHFYKRGQEITDMLKKRGFQPSFIHIRYLNDVDTALLDELKEKHHIIVTLEDGIISGGYGSKVATFYGAYPVQVLCYGAKKEFTDLKEYDDIIKDNRLSPEQIVADIMALMPDSSLPKTA